MNIRKEIVQTWLKINFMQEERAELEIRGKKNDKRYSLEGGLAKNLFK